MKLILKLQFLSPIAENKNEVKDKRLQITWKMMTLAFFEVYTVYKKELRQLFFHTYSLT